MREGARVASVGNAPWQPCCFFLRILSSYADVDKQNNQGPTDRPYLSDDMREGERDSVSAAHTVTCAASVLCSVDLMFRVCAPQPSIPAGLTMGGDVLQQCQALLRLAAADLRDLPDRYHREAWHGSLGTTIDRGDVSSRSVGVEATSHFCPQSRVQGLPDTRVVGLSTGGGPGGLLVVIMIGGG